MSTQKAGAKSLPALNREKAKELIRRYVESALRSAKGSVRTIRARHLSFLGIDPKVASDILAMLCYEWPCGCEVLETSRMGFIFKKC